MEKKTKTFTQLVNDKRYLNKLAHILVTYNKTTEYYKNKKEVKNDNN